MRLCKFYLGKGKLLPRFLNGYKILKENYLIQIQMGFHLPAIIHYANRACLPLMLCRRPMPGIYGGTDQLFHKLEFPVLPSKPNVEALNIRF
jgi:hypothetical protein